MTADPELEDSEYDDGPDLGPDDRDRDLLDGTWEARYYRGQERVRNWNAIGAGVALIVLVAMVLPMILVFVN